MEYNRERLSDRTAHGQSSPLAMGWPSRKLDSRELRAGPDARPPAAAR
jgi:hypothetical protein